MPHLLKLLVHAVTPRRILEYVTWPILRIGATILDTPIHVPALTWDRQRMVNRLAKAGLNAEMSGTFSVDFDIGRMRQVLASSS